MNEKELGTKKISALAVKFIIPSVLGMIFMSLQSMIDGFFVGRYAGQTALGALNIVMPVLNVAMAAAMVISVGAQSLMSMYLGAGKKEKARDIFRTATVGILCISVLVMMGGVFFANPISKLLGASEAFLPHSSVYLRTISFFAIPFILWFLCDFTLRILGKPQIGMVAMITGALVNIALDFLFLKVWGMGIFGAALTTGISFSVSFLISVIYLFNKNATINFYQGKFKFKSLYKMAFNGLSEGINALSSAIVMLIINLKLMSLVGDNGVVAYTAILYVVQIGFCIMCGVTDGLRPIISYNFGTQSHGRLKKIMLLDFILGFVFGALVFVLLTFFGEPLIKIFVTDPEIIPIGVTGAKLIAIGFLISGANVVMSGYFTAINFAIESAVVAILRGLVFIIIGVFTLPLAFGINGVWLSMPFADILTAMIMSVVFIIYYKRKTLFFGKKGNEIVAKEESEYIAPTESQEPQEIQETLEKSDPQEQLDK